MKLSAGVIVKESDLSTSVPQLASSVTAMVGAFSQGPCTERVLITNVKSLEEVYGKPDDTNYIDWFTAYNILQYNQLLYINRAENSTMLNAGLGFTTVSTLATAASVSDIRLNDTDDFDATDISFNTGEKLRILARYPGAYGNSIKVSTCPSTSFTTATIYGTTKFVDLFDKATLETNDVAVVVQYPDPIDTSTWAIVETHICSTSPTAKDYNGQTTWIGEYINRNSSYICAYTGDSSTFALPVSKEVALVGGTLGTYTSADFDEAYDIFANPEDFDFSILVDCHNTTLNSAASVAALQKSVVDKMVGTSKRNDIFFVLSPYSGDVVKKTPSQAQAALETYVKTTLNKPTSYAALYGNWKYQYDRYNDKYRWLPLSGDIAGIFASNDATRELWFAPAGLTRGQIKNCIKLAFNPDKGVRDILYKNNINPVVSFPGEGHVVLGQKTLLTASSAFSRVAVRRLFNYMEKAISIASRYFLFEKNNTFTRRQWISIVDPFLADIKAKEGLLDYAVLCDSSNNGSTQLDNNQLVASIFVKPASDIEEIELNFINTKNGVDFKEITNRA